MMELHEENKVMREALEEISNRSRSWEGAAASECLSAIGPAAQPEDEAAPDWRAIAEGRALELCDLQERLEKAEAAMINAECEVARLGLEKKNAQPEPQADRCDALQDLQYVAGFDAGFMAGERGDFGARDAAHKRTAGAREALRQAPQAGDELGSIDTPEFCDLITELQTAHGYINGDKSKASWATLVASIDAIRREAYDKGRAEGAGQARDAQDGWYGAANWLRNNYQDHANIESLCDAMETSAPDAAPPASAAQQDNGDDDERVDSMGRLI